MANSKNVPKPNAANEVQIKTYDPTKSKFGKVILIILILGMVLGLFITAIVEMAKVLG
ncbi:MAG: hypothetical protein PHC62_07755 [Candidatus Izemoplasmatales bacterium]|jgi:hypothetical protein|nr:hypothetical protein [Candidatus Izemoplasmatales bacterium]